MSRIADLLERDFSRPIEEFVKVDNNDPDVVFTELSEYVATNRIRAEYERLIQAMAEAPKSPNESVGVWISGFSGSGKSLFAKNLGYVLADREVRGCRASSLFLRQVGSESVTEDVEFLNTSATYEAFLLDVQVDQPAHAEPEHLAEVMYRAVRRGLDPTRYADTCLSQSPPSGEMTVKEVVSKLFDLCEAQYPGKSIAFIVDEVGQYIAHVGERLDHVVAVVEQLGKESAERLKAGRIPGPAWIVVTAEETLQEVCDATSSDRVDMARLRRCFKHQIETSAADIREATKRRVLRKKKSQEPILRKLFQDRGTALFQSVKLERTTRRTDFDEDQFVQFYPYLPHLIDLSIDIMAGIRLQPNAPQYLGSSNRTMIKQSFEMLESDRTRLADEPVGVLVSIDKIYDLVDGNIAWEKQKAVLDVRQRFDDHKDYPGMAARVAKAICLMEFVRTDLPRTTQNIAALLIQRVTETPQILAVAAILERLKAAHFVCEAEDGWKLYGFDELRRVAAALELQRTAVGTINPRPSGWHNDLIQVAKKLLARSLTWYTRPMCEFNASVSRSMAEIVSVFDHLSMNMVALEHLSMNMVDLEKRHITDRLAPQLLDHLSMNLVALEQLSTNMIALEGQLAQSNRMNRAVMASMQEQLDQLRDQMKVLASNDWWDAPCLEHQESYIQTDLRHNRTTYVVGLFGTGRRYVNELIMQNLGERAKYFRDTIRLHPGPTPMIYSGHATMKHVSREQELPAVMSRISEAVGSGFANLIFVYRHPLDSLLTNWIWWRTYIRENRRTSGISQVYQNSDDLCADLEQHFYDFRAFAEGDADFFAGLGAPRFLSFFEFVEETELHLKAATLALRLEDFMADPLKEFSKIVEVVSPGLNLSRSRLAAPKTKPYGHVTVREKVPRFKDFIDELDTETKERIENIGFSLGI